jgi:hypothetical protein
MISSVFCPIGRSQLLKWQDKIEEAGEQVNRGFEIF